jgi:glutamate-1-semialdehyde 2,1-aminomutase
MSDGERQKSIFEPIEDPRFAHRAHELIPGGCHTYAKGDDQFPVNAPRYLMHGHGCRVYDDAQREFIEYGMGLRSVTLGHAFSEVVEAAYRQMQLGSNFGRIAPVELECATQLLGMVPRADMVKFAKDGSTVTTAALKLARAYTGRKLIAICADQPFFSYDDWFIGTTGIDAGVDSAAVAHTLRFRYNDADSLTQLFTTYPEQIACVMLEAARIEEPRPDFLPAIRRLCDEHGALLVLDEMVTGFRWSNGGAQAV